MIADLLIRFLLWISRKTPPRLIPDRGTFDLTVYGSANFKKGDGIAFASAEQSYDCVVVDELPGRLKVAFVYLARHFLTKSSPDTEAMDRHVKKPPRLGVYLHNFRRPDGSGELHDHPWKWAISLVLKAGYSEERRYVDKSSPTGFGIFRREVMPWSLNFLRGETFHRVDLPRGEAWTLFIVGPVKKSWGFWDRETGVYTPWKKFLGVDDVSNQESA